MTRQTHVRRIAAGSLLATLLITAAGCAGGGDSDAGGESGDMGGPAAVEVEPQTPEAATDGLAAGRNALEDSASVQRSAGGGAEEAPEAPEAEVEETAMIRTAHVVLEADDVVEARDAVDRIVRKYAGEIQFEESSGGDDAGWAEVVLRVPEKDFTEVLDAIKGVAKLERSTQQGQDVSQQVIDTRARIRAQERSIRRIEVLLDQATSIRDIFAIEGELADRQGQLDSLKQRQAHLADQTAMSTITVNIERTPDKEEKDDEEKAGFLPGLKDGWDAFTDFTVGVLTVVGVLIPFLIVLVPAGLLAWYVGRRALRRAVDRRPAPQGSGA